MSIERIWIPSKRRIVQRLAEDLKVALQSNPSPEVGFYVFLDKNAHLIPYIGEEAFSSMIDQVATELCLVLEEGNYVQQEKPCLEDS